MWNKKIIIFTLVAGLLNLLVPASISAAPKIAAGKICKTLKEKATANGQGFICTKSGKKLVWKKVNKQTNSVNSLKPDENKGVLGSLDFKNPMIYDTKGSQLIRRADSGDYFESDVRDASAFNSIRFKAYQELNPSNLEKSHPNINFIYSISESFPSFLVEWSKRELDEAAALWNSYFDRKIDVYVNFITEKDREAIKSNSWLQKNFPEIFTRFESKQERPFISGGGGYWPDENGWNGKIVLATASYLDNEYVNYEWPAIPKHEFVHLVQDYAFAKNGRIRGNDSEWVAIQPLNFREGSANTIGYLTAFRNLGWSNDAMDWVTWKRAKETSSWKPVGSVKEVRALMTATDFGSPDEAFIQSYGVGALMYEWVIGTYGFAGYKKLMDNFPTSINFEQSVQLAFGISKDDFYDRASAYVYQEYSRVFS